jgi:ribonucleoside-diphosphate reductase alpha chain
LKILVIGFLLSLSDNDEHRHALSDILLNMRFMPAGRVQAAIGAPKRVTPWNCFVSGTISDDFNDIMEKAKEAGHTMRLGGGIGYDFSTLRPRGSLIKSLNSQSSGPISFMDIFDSVCGTISSAGHRRGAQMGVLRVDHPDIEEFINAKQNSSRLTRFNISIAVTDAFMKAVKKGTDFNLKFHNKTYKTVDARALWDQIMRSTWHWAEPGVLFIDRINEYNNLWYCETISTTNPCGEQPLPPYGACLLGSFNLVKYVDREVGALDDALFVSDIRNVVRAMDNIIDVGIYPLPQQETEGKAKRRMGLGITGLANALEAIGRPYGSAEFIKLMNYILTLLRDTAYEASAELAREKGPFPLYSDKFLDGKFIKSLPQDVLESIKQNGIRNSHLLSIAPTGTISLAADNISSGIEPVFTHSYTRTIITMDGVRNEDVDDFAYREWDVRGRTAAELSPEEHVSVLINAQKYIDSSCSKTCNIGPDVSWERFCNTYMMAFDGGAKGCTTYRSAGKRMGILNEKPKEEYIDDEDTVCKIDELTGQPTCS